MSEYIQFYAKSNTGEMLPLGTFSRSSLVYLYGKDYVPSYDIVKPMTAATLGRIVSEIRDSVAQREKNIEREKSRMNLISQMSGNIEDKIEALDDCIVNIEEMEEGREEIIQALGFYQVLEEMVEEVRGSKWYTDERFRYDPDNYVYAGIECERYEGVEEEQQIDRTVFIFGSAAIS